MVNYHYVLVYKQLQRVKVNLNLYSFQFEKKQRKDLGKKKRIFFKEGKVIPVCSVIYLNSEIIARNRGAKFFTFLLKKTVKHRFAKLI